MTTKARRNLLMGAFGALICATLIGTIFACYRWYCKDQLERDPTRSHIVRDFLKPGVVIDVVVLSKNQLPEDCGARVITRGDVFLLSSPEQLEGMVTVETPSQALHFARLRTTYCNLIRRDPAHEIVSVNHLHDPVNYDVEHQSPYDIFHSGMYGVLSQRAYQQGDFTPAVVTPIPRGYVIDRWVWRDDFGSRADTLEHWHETVSRDGAYAQTTMKSEPLPNLPGTQFRVYMKL